MKRMQILATLAIGAILGIAVYTMFVAFAQPSEQSEIVITHRFDTSNCTMKLVSTQIDAASSEGITGIPIPGFSVNCE